MGGPYKGKGKENVPPFHRSGISEGRRERLAITKQEAAGGGGIGRSPSLRDPRCDTCELSAACRPGAPPRLPRPGEPTPCPAEESSGARPGTARSCTRRHSSPPATGASFLGLLARALPGNAPHPTRHLKPSNSYPHFPHSARTSLPQEPSFSLRREVSRPSSLQTPHGWLPSRAAPGRSRSDPARPALPRPRGPGLPPAPPRLPTPLVAFPGLRPAGSPPRACPPREAKPDTEDSGAPANDRPVSCTSLLTGTGRVNRSPVLETTRKEDEGPALGEVTSTPPLQSVAASDISNSCALWPCDLPSPAPPGSRPLPPPQDGSSRALSIISAACPGITRGRFRFAAAEAHVREGARVPARRRSAGAGPGLRSSPSAPSLPALNLKSPPPPPQPSRGLETRRPRPLPFPATLQGPKACRHVS